MAAVPPIKSEMILKKKIANGKNRRPPRQRRDGEGADEWR
jgi:hypothetical protein